MSNTEWKVKETVTNFFNYLFEAQQYYFKTRCNFDIPVEYTNLFYTLNIIEGEKIVDPTGRVNSAFDTSKDYRVGKIIEKPCSSTLLVPVTFNFVKAKFVLSFNLLTKDVPLQLSGHEYIFNIHVKYKKGVL